MKPLKFLPSFIILVIILFTFGALINLEDIKNGEFAVVIFVALIAIIASLTMSFVLLRIRATDNQDFKRLFSLYFIFYLCKTLSFGVFIILSSSTHLTLIKILLFLGIAIIGGYLMAKASVRGNMSKTAA